MRWPEIALMGLYAWGVPNAKETKMTTRTTKAERDRIETQIEAALAELRDLGRLTKRTRPRRRILQERIAALGQDLRRAYGME